MVKMSISQKKVSMSHLGKLLKTDSDAGSQGYSLRFCIFNKLPSDAAGPRTTL
jgi:hypothetical protein